jgi:hypothetical protein
MLIPLIPTKKDSEKSTIGFYVRTDPDDADSDKVKKYVPTFDGTGDLEEMMEFLTDFYHLIELKNDQDNGPALFTTMLLLLEDDARESWTDSYEEFTAGLAQGDPDRDRAAFEATLEGWMNGLLAGEENIANDLKDELQSLYKKKPVEMTISKVAKRIKKINKFIGILPGDTQSLSDRELLSVLKKLVPNSWLNDLKKKADYANITFASALKYFKILEELDPPPNKNVKLSKNNSSPGGHNKNDKSSSRNNNNKKTDGSGNVSRRSRGRNNRPRNNNNLRRSNRNRGPYCPHHRTNDHDGANCPEYQAYKAGRNNNRGQGRGPNNRSNNGSRNRPEANAIERAAANPNEANRIEHDSDEELYQIDQGLECPDDFFDYFTEDLKSIDIRNAYWTVPIDTNNTHQYLANDCDLVPYDFGPDINSEEDPIVEILYDSADSESDDDSNQPPPLIEKEDSSDDNSTVVPALQCWSRRADNVCDSSSEDESTVSDDAASLIEPSVHEEECFANESANNSANNSDDESDDDYCDYDLDDMTDAGAEHPGKRIEDAIAFEHNLQMIRKYPTRIAWMNMKRGKTKTWRELVDEIYEMAIVQQDWKLEKKTGRVQMFDYTDKTDNPVSHKFPNLKEVMEDLYYMEQRLEPPPPPFVNVMEVDGARVIHDNSDQETLTLAPQECHMADADDESISSDELCPQGRLFDHGAPNARKMADRNKYIAPPGPEAQMKPAAHTRSPTNYNFPALKDYLSPNSNGWRHCWQQDRMVLAAIYITVKRIHSDCSNDDMFDTYMERYVQPLNYHHITNLRDLIVRLPTLNHYLKKDNRFMFPRLFLETLADVALSLYEYPNHPYRSPISEEQTLRLDPDKRPELFNIEEAEPELTQKLRFVIKAQMARSNWRTGKAPHMRPTFDALIDTGSSLSLVAADMILPDMQIDPSKMTKFDTQNGPFKCKGTTNLDIVLPQFSEHRKLSQNFHVTPMKGKYAMIIGRDLCQKMKLVINFSDNTITWDDLTLEMSSKRRSAVISDDDDTDNTNELFVSSTTPASDKYKIEEALPEHLSSEQRTKLAQILLEHYALFQDGIGKFPGPPYSVEPKAPPLKPYYRKPYRIPFTLLNEAKAEIQHLVDIGVLKPIYDSPWGSPAMALRKPTGGLRIVSDFRQVNTMLRRKPYPMPKIDELFQSIDGFDWCSSLDLTKGFYNIVLDEESQKIFTTVLPWGKYAWVRMPMGYIGAPDAFQHKMDQFLGDLPFCAVFLDDVCIWTKGTFDEHLQHIAVVLDRLNTANVRVNLKKSTFLAEKMKYLGFIFTKDGVRADPAKVNSIQDLMAPKTRKQLRGFLGMTNYLRQHIPRYSHYTAPLTDLLKGDNKKKFEWPPEADKAFNNIKQQISKAVLLSFPDYNQPFHIYTDASNYQIGAVILQQDETGRYKPPVGFFSKKMNDAQKKYTVTEQELLSIVETLRNYRCMLLGRHITIFTDHKNLTFEKFASNRVARWRLYVEEFGPELKYLPGKHNVVADALSRLPMRETNDIDETDDTDPPELMEIADIDDHCPVDYRILADKQKAEIPEKVYHKAKSKQIGDIELKVNKNGRVMVPESLREPLMEFYHETLRHPGIVRMSNSLWMNFAWPTLKEDVTEYVENCTICQKFKKNQKHYGHLPKADPRTLIPWDTVAVDLIGPWKIKAKNKTVYLTALTACDLATRWPEIQRIHVKDSETVALVFDRCWINRYPRPSKVIHDQGTEFSGEFSELLQSTGIQEVITTVKNPRANAILERMHGVMGDMLRSYDFSNQVIDDWDKSKLDPLDGFLSAVAFALRAAYQTSIGTSPVSLAFGRDMFFPTKYVANWKAMKIMREKQMEKGRLRENSKRLPHKYKPGQLILIRHDMDGQPRGKMRNPTSGPFRVHRVLGSTLEIDRGAYREKINIRRVQPYRP